MCALTPEWPDLDAFARLVHELIASLPDDIRAALENVEFIVEQAPRPGSPFPPDSLLGLYHGVPRSQRGVWYAGALPDRITLYRRNLMARAGRPDNLRATVLGTLVHEIGHHLGMNEKQIRELGY